MFLDLPHLRYDGVYVSRNTYIRTGITEWRVKNPVHLVCYYRYLRFFPTGDFAYRTCPETIAQVSLRTAYNEKCPDSTSLLEAVKQLQCVTGPALQSLHIEVP